MNNQHIKDYALKHYKEGNSVTELAKEIKGYFDYDLTVEQIRKIASREINKQDKLVEQFKEEVNKIPLPSKSGGTFFRTTFKYTDLKQKIQEAFYPKTKYTTSGTYLLLGCVHVPGHNQSMTYGIKNLIRDIDLKGLILMGDFLDLNTLSGHDKDKFTAIKGLTLDEEYKEGNKVLDQLLFNLSPEADKIYLYGNHEDRWNRYMSNMQNAKTPLQSPEEALKLKERGFNVFTRWSSDYITLGNHLEVLHGQYYNTHCAKQHIDKFRGSVAFVHTHRIQMYVEGKTAGFNIGWGGDVNHPFFNYAERGTKNQWQNGFALCTIDEQGDYFMQQIFCHNNKFYYNGKPYGS